MTTVSQLLADINPPLLIFLSFKRKAEGDDDLRCRG